MMEIMPSDQRIRRNAKSRKGHRNRRWALSFERFEERLLMAGDWQNSRNSLDVDDSGSVSPLDALIVINDVDQQGSRQLRPRRLITSM